MKNIVLVGFMGSGKSLVAKALSERLKMKAVSTDELIEHKEKRTIADIFKDSGEGYFRKLEHTTVREVSGLTDTIIDCGGGVVLNPKNIELLKRNGTLFYLSVTPDIVVARLQHLGSRPLLKVPNPREKIIELLAQRLPLYQQADHIVDSSDPSLEKPVAEILRILGK